MKKERRKAKEQLEGWVRTKCSRRAEIASCSLPLTYLYSPSPVTNSNKNTRRKVEATSIRMNKIKMLPAIIQYNDIFKGQTLSRTVLTEDERPRSWGDGAGLPTQRSTIATDPGIRARRNRNADAPELCIPTTKIRWGRFILPLEPLVSASRRHIPVLKAAAQASG